MIVKILSKGGNGFAGVQYNERKNDQGTSELLAAENFGALGHGGAEISKADYINYLKMTAALNPRVTNKQFHAIVSTKERNHSPEELRDIAEQYLEKMGYGNNPYLIYSHTDTDNNHVHIVTTRVDKQGNKVDDSFERVRSQKVMQEILGQSAAEEVKRDVATSIEYTFKTIPQFKLLFEQKGYKVSEKDGQLQLIKFGQVQQSIQRTDIISKIERQESNEQAIADRAKQLKAIFKKYKVGLSGAELADLLKNKFGVDIVFHQKEEHQTPYGFTVLDHAKKFVFKGGEIMKLQELISRATDDEKVEKLKKLISALKPESEFTHLEKKVQELGFTLDKQGNVVSRGGGNIILTLDSQILKGLKYQTRIQEASEYRVGNEAELKALAKLHYVRPEDLKTSTANLDQERNIIAEKMSAISQFYEINEGLQSLRLTLVKHLGNFYVIDKDSKVLIDYQKIDQKNISLHHAEYSDLDIKTAPGRVTSSDQGRTIRTDDSPKEATKNAASVTIALPNQVGEDGQASNKRKRKRKR